MFSTKKQLKDQTRERVVCTTDIHTHVLPCLDDGSGSARESLEMLKLSHSHGVKRIVATPHFYSHKHKIEDFLSERERAFEDLKEALLNDPEAERLVPELYVGAEVSYFSGMSRSESVEKLCIRGTRMILVEMPFDVWNDNMLEDLFSVNGNLGVLPIVAHVDRYLRIQPKEVIESLFERDVLIQANAQGFVAPSTRKRVLNYLSEDKIDLLGSDCHNLSKRPPDLLSATDIISKKIGDEVINRLNEFADFAFKDVECEM